MIQQDWSNLRKTLTLLKQAMEESLEETTAQGIRPEVASYLISRLRAVEDVLHLLEEPMFNRDSTNKN